MEIESIAIEFVQAEQVGLVSWENIILGNVLDQNTSRRWSDSISAIELTQRPLSITAPSTMMEAEVRR